MALLDRLNEWQSKRLHITKFDNLNNRFSDEFLHQVIEVLTDKVVADLPPSWHGIKTTEQAKNWLNQQSQEGTLYLMTLNEDGSDTIGEQLVGFLVLYESMEKGMGSRVHLGYAIAEIYWGKGLATEVLNALVSSLSTLKVELTLLAGVAEKNLASRRVLEKAGFQQVEGNPQEVNLFYSLSISTNGN